MRILLVEDHVELQHWVSKALRDAKLTVECASSGADADALLHTQDYALVILDLTLPRMDGLDVLRRLRQRKSRVPVLIATARDAVEERIAGLDAGADDYVLKPFVLEELLARIRALLRRSAGRAEPVFEHAGITVDPATREVTRNGEPVTLSAREWAVLEALLARPGAVLSRAQLEEKLYSWDSAVTSNAVEVYIHGLRRKLGAEFVRTVRGVG